MRTAVIENGVVVNVVEAPTGWAAPTGSIAITSATAQIGDSYANGVFTSPPAPALTAAQLIAYAAAVRDARIAAGLTVNIAAPWSPAVNVVVSGAADKQSLLMGAMLSATNGGTGTINWGTRNGVVALTAANVKTVFAAAQAYAQNVFNVYNAIVAGANATPPTITTTAQIDGAAWPTNS